MREIILASASPQRRDLLSQLGLPFQVVPSNAEENAQVSIPPHALAQSLSYQKAKVIADQSKNALVIAADTFIVFQGQILGKPQGDLAAYNMLATLNGKSHIVITGFTIIDTESGKTISRSVETVVHMKSLTHDEITRYVKSGEPLDKAGAYAIQGLGAVIIDKIEGDYTNVVGLPLSTLAESLRKFDIPLP